ncbi:hypothetical protein EDD18DRAFT_1098030 [Armillaria luteobubalina]|uniref:Uncharacterized protein n=1 Tax=Armillaria luteobubalina TaxID=153913 RepID=A0AA39UWV3_9AGAR|nr:hypothetical protein EDD18DRAFT_1098030 [Armillaria luteobubalina]
MSEQLQKEFLRQCFQTHCFQCAIKEETEDEVLDDEFHLRRVEHANHQTQHTYKLSYADEVGSSLDPDMEDLESESQSLPKREELTPKKHEIMELQAYTDECEQQAALADFEDILKGFWDNSDLNESEGDVMDIS